MRLGRFLAGLAIGAVLRVVTRIAAPADRRARRRGPARRDAPARRPAPPPERSRALLGVMAVSLALALPLMILFENRYTRIAGVLAMFAFIISGVFAVADPRFLAAGDDDG